MDRVCEASFGECSDRLPAEGARQPPPPPPLPRVRHVADKTVSRVRPPVSILLTTLLYLGEFTSAGFVTFAYSRSSDSYWMGLTLLFMLMPAIMDQFTLIFVHRDLTSDKPMVLFMHLLLLGPFIRCVEAMMIYWTSGRTEEPYVSITRQKQLRKGSELVLEQEVGHSVRRLVTHRNAFRRMAVIQAFLGSTPQLTLQLYVSVVEQYVPTGRAVLMSICLVSITYGALVCNILAIQIKYDDYKIDLHPLAFVCIVLWRSLEISTRITVLVFFGSVFKEYTVAIGSANFLVFFFMPWVQLWRSGGQLPESVEKNFSRLGTIVVLLSITLLYGGINIFCWSAVQLRLADRDLIAKTQSWVCLVVYYIVRGLENSVLILVWYFFRTDVYDNICPPFLVVQLLVGYCLAIAFMLLFMQYFHPCRLLFTHNVSDYLECVCCRRSGAVGALRLEPPYEPGVRHSIV
ncbi:XK-related protein 2 [Hemicordylus capensis]|uniref:XK-related protein 2 n=1 Tax=Hemicordylus capensis TaxID=884348 RepID=UPI002303F9DC|nr:XK-related protein 2 [Hemicordylus capensis]